MNLYNIHRHFASHAMYPFFKLEYHINAIYKQACLSHIDIICTYLKANVLKAKEKNDSEYLKG